MSIKRYRIFLSSLIFVVIIACLSTVIIHYSNEEQDDIQISNDETGFLVMEHDERIGLFKAGESAPFRVLDVYVETLPYQDKLSLKEGIKVISEEELQQLIEDYDS